MTFNDFIASKGGVAKVADAAKARRRKVSRTHLYNILARRKRVTPNIVRQLRPLYPDVTADMWLQWLTEDKRLEARA